MWGYTFVDSGRKTLQTLGIYGGTEDTDIFSLDNQHKALQVYSALQSKLSQAIAYISA